MKSESGSVAVRPTHTPGDTLHALRAAYLRSMGGVLDQPIPVSVPKADKTTPTIQTAIQSEFPISDWCATHSSLGNLRNPPAALAGFC